MNISARPSDLVGYKASPLERLLFDSAVIRALQGAEIEGGPNSAAAQIMKRRHASGLYA